MVVDCLGNRSIRTLIFETMLGGYAPQTPREEGATLFDAAAKIDDASRFGKESALNIFR